MRLHPLTLAMRYLRGTLRPFGRRAFDDRNDAFRLLRDWTGQDFGDDLDAWAAWLKTNRAAYSRSAFRTQHTTSSN